MSSYGNYSLFVLLHFALTLSLSLINNMWYEVHGCRQSYRVSFVLRIERMNQDALFTSDA